MSLLVENIIFGLRKGFQYRLTVMCILETYVPPKFGRLRITYSLFFLLII